MDITVKRNPQLIRSNRASPQLRTGPAVFASALLAFAAAACEPEAPSNSAIRSDSAGVMLIEYPGLPPIEESRIAIADEPDLVLGDGKAFEGPDHEFFRVFGVAQLRDGTLIVANQGSSELRFYGADGHFLRSVGRDGDGPGEFRLVQGPWIIEGDTIVVFDPSLRRFQHFGPDGVFVRATSMVAVPFTEFSTRPPVVETVLGNGRAVVSLESPLRRSDGAERLPRLVALHRIDNGGWDSVRVVPGPEEILEVRDGRFFSPGYYLGAYPMAAGSGATLAVADGALFRVEIFDSHGHLDLILSVPVPEIPVTHEVIEGEVAHQLTYRLPNRPAWADGATEFEGRIRQVIGTNHAPSLPAIRDVFVDADERIWVERYDVPASGPSRWEVFERDGTWVGRVEMPEGFARGMRAWFPWAPYFSVASGRLAGVWTDPVTGLETVRVYRVIEPDS